MGAALLRRYGFDSRLERLRDVLLLVGLAALVSTAAQRHASACCGAVAGTRPDRARSLPAFWAVWWVGDVLGDLLVAPLIFAWASAPRLSRRPASLAGGGRCWPSC